MGPSGRNVQRHLRQDKLGFLLITQRYAAIGSPLLTFAAVIEDVDRLRRQLL